MSMPPQQPGPGGFGQGPGGYGQYPPGQGQPPQYPPPQQPYGQYPGGPPQAPQGAKTPVWVWILVAAGVVILLGLVAVGVGGYFLVKKVQNAGFDPALMQKNPGLALAKMAAAMNPDAEVISTNDSTGTITIKDKSSGKVVTLKFDAEKKSLVVVDENGKEAKIAVSGDDKNASVTVEGPDGTAKFGAAAGNNAPAWVPVYPGAATEGTFSTQTNDGTQNSFGFKTKDSADKVIAYYQEQLKAAGYTMNTMATGGSGGMLQAEDAAKGRSLIITAGSSGDGTEGSVTAVEKKK